VDSLLSLIRLVIIVTLLMILFCLCYLLTSIFSITAKENDCFRAAVYEHVQQSDNKSADVRHLIELNLKVYENVAKEAALHVYYAIYFLIKDSKCFNFY
jgi:hypothetical protein